MRHRVVITVHPGGRMESRVEGIAGPACAEASRWLDRLGKVTRHEHTDEYYQAEVEVETEATMGGDDGSY
jgi:hypothetical protein